ncbi:GntR family transcriptional regulator [Curvivirga aplysinae]|uniref:GntR family transcriptional regulator n=1 Tax=Curvivirga aplysinae TaxID=2529852 RepID=UPI0012BD59CC|nr:GntR family transcriptional regulator [Curvivirga aplysinae]MTI09844.1 GntR family transcriptional regulator [Curvivirga aplysinae]
MSSEIDNSTQDTPEHLTLQEKVYQQLRLDIMLGNFEPGKAITIRGLAEELGTSPMPVREALRRLVAERALELLPNRRVTVPKMTAEKYRELADARVAMEALAARRAMAHITPDRLTDLRELDKEIDQAILRNDVETYLIKNMEFHFTLYQYGPSQIIMPLIESLWLQIGPFLKMAMRSKGLGTVEDQHQAAMKAIEDNDADSLSRAISLDILDGVNRLPDEEFDRIN